MTDMDMPIEGQEVCRLNMKRNLIVGHVDSVDTEDSLYPSFTVEWTGGKTQYPMRAWRDRVSPTTCAVCDSETHNEFAHSI